MYVELNGTIRLTNLTINSITWYKVGLSFDEIISGNTSIYNTFRYKGYYCDSDIEKYYCKSRFYVPYWHRWLNADSVEYLDINNV